VGLHDGTVVDDAVHDQFDGNDDDSADDADPLGRGQALVRATNAAGTARPANWFCG